MSRFTQYCITPEDRHTKEAQGLPAPLISGLVELLQPTTPAARATLINILSYRFSSHDCEQTPQTPTSPAAHPAMFPSASPVSDTRDGRPQTHSTINGATAMGAVEECMEDDDSDRYDFMACPFLDPADAIPRYRSLTAELKAETQSMLSRIIKQFSLVVESNRIARGRGGSGSRGDWTHTCFNGGLLNIPFGQKLDAFQYAYAYALNMGEKVYVAERITAPVFVLFLDLDWKCYSAMTPEQCVEVVEVITDVVRQYFPDIEHDGWNCIVSSTQYKPVLSTEPGVPDMVKSGMHLVWPGLLVTKAQVAWLVEAWRDALRHRFHARRSPANSFEDVIQAPKTVDDGVYDKGCRMIGSDKIGDCPYCLAERKKQKAKRPKAIAAAGRAQHEAILSVPPSQLVTETLPGIDAEAGNLCPLGCQNGRVEEGRVYMPMFAVDWEGRRNRKLEAALLDDMVFMVRQCSIRSDALEPSPGFKPPKNAPVPDSAAARQWQQQQANSSSLMGISPGTFVFQTAGAGAGPGLQTEGAGSASSMTSSMSDFMSSASFTQGLYQDSPAATGRVGSAARDERSPMPLVEDLLAKRPHPTITVSILYSAIQLFIQDPNTFPPHNPYRNCYVDRIKVSTSENLLRISIRDPVLNPPNGEEGSKYCYNVGRCHSGNRVYFHLSATGLVQRCPSNAHSPTTGKPCQRYQTPQPIALPRNSPLQQHLKTLFEWFRVKRITERLQEEHQAMVRENAFQSLMNFSSDGAHVLKEQRMAATLQHLGRSTSPSMMSSQDGDASSSSPLLVKVPPRHQVSLASIVGMLPTDQATLNRAGSHGLASLSSSPCLGLSHQRSVDDKYAMLLRIDPKPLGQDPAFAAEWLKPSGPAKATGALAVSSGARGSGGSDRAGGGSALGIPHAGFPSLSGLSELPGLEQHHPVKHMDVREVTEALWQRLGSFVYHVTHADIPAVTYQRLHALVTQPRYSKRMTPFRALFVLDHVVEELLNGKDDMVAAFCVPDAAQDDQSQEDRLQQQPRKRQMLAAAGQDHDDDDDDDDDDDKDDQYDMGPPAPSAPLTSPTTPSASQLPLPTPFPSIPDEVLQRCWSMLPLEFQSADPDKVLLPRWKSLAPRAHRIYAALYRRWMLQINGLRPKYQQQLVMLELHPRAALKNMWYLLVDACLAQYADTMDPTGRDPMFRRLGGLGWSAEKIYQDLHGGLHVNVNTELDKLSRMYFVKQQQKRKAQRQRAAAHQEQQEQDPTYPASPSGTSRTSRASRASGPSRTSKTSVANASHQQHGATTPHSHRSFMTPRPSRILMAGP